jgi:hypothetical protein
MTTIPPQRKRRRFVRDVEIHGHNRHCEVYEWENRDVVECQEDPGGRPPCTCVELDHDDWIAAGEREYDAWREDGPDKEERDEQEA